MLVSQVEEVEADRLELRGLAHFSPIGVFEDAYEEILAQPQGGGRVDDDYAVERSAVVDAEAVDRLGVHGKGVHISDGNEGNALRSGQVNLALRRDVATNKGKVHLVHLGSSWVWQTRQQQDASLLEPPERPAFVGGYSIQSPFRFFMLTPSSRSSLGSCVW